MTILRDLWQLKLVESLVAERRGSTQPDVLLSGIRVVDLAAYGVIGQLIMPTIGVAVLLALIEIVNRA